MPMDRPTAYNYKNDTMKKRPQLILENGVIYTLNYQNGQNITKTPKIYICLVRYQNKHIV